MRYAWLALGGLLVLAAAGCGRGSASAPPDVGHGLALREVLEARAAAEGGGTDAAAAAQPTGFATLKGVFRVAGAPPQRAALKVDKDQEVCAPGGMAPLDESVVVAADGGLKDVLLYLDMKLPSGDDRWIAPSYRETETAVIPFDQKQCVFLSRVFAMRSTQTMRVLNSDPIGHNTKLSPRDDAKPDNFTIAVGGSVDYRPGGSEGAPFEAACSIHPWMLAWIIVRDDPYFAVTAPDGSFEIKDVPAGVELTFRVWQERLKFVQQVKLDGQDAAWSRGRFAVTLQPGATRTLEVEIDAAAFAAP